MQHTTEQRGYVARCLYMEANNRLIWGAWWRLLGLIEVCMLLGLGMMPVQAAPFAYIANGGSNNVSLIDTATQTATAIVPVGAGPRGVAVHPAGTFVYVTNSFDNTVSVLNTATNTVTATVPVRSGPNSVAIGPSIAPPALIMASATPAPYGRGKSTSAPEERGVQALRRHSECPKVADTVIEAAPPPAQPPPAQPPPAQPTLTLTLAGCTTCQAGDTFSVTATVRNPTTTRVTVEIKAGVVLPDGTAVNVWAVADKHFTVQLPAGLNTTVEILRVQLPNGLPRGAWSYEAALVDPELGRTIARDTKAFIIQ